MDQSNLLLAEGRSLALAILLYNFPPFACFLIGPHLPIRRVILRPVVTCVQLRFCYIRKNTWVKNDIDAILPSSFFRPDPEARYYICLLTYSRVELATSGVSSPGAVVNGRKALVVISYQSLIDDLSDRIVNCHI